MNRQHTLSEFNGVWAIMHDRFLAMVSALKTAGPAQAAYNRKLPKVAGAIAVLPMHGVIMQHPNGWLDEIGYTYTSTEQFGRAFGAAINSPEIKGVVIDVNSPGGSVPGTPELSQQIFSARGQKPIVAVANGLAASAAYWLATSADRLVIAPSGDCGSIGVFSVHEDWSKALDDMGIKITYVAAGKYKVEGNDAEPLSDEARTYLQGRADAIYAEFLADVGRNRGISASAVKNDYGEGRVLRAKDALAAGMVDKVATMDAVLKEMGGGMRSGGRTAAKSKELETMLCEAMTAPVPIEPDEPENGGSPDLLRRKLRLKNTAKEVGVTLAKGAE